MKILYIPNIDELMANRHLFNSFVYTTPGQAVAELECRKENQKLRQYINGLLPSAIPNNFLGEKNAVLGRQLATPNFEMREFYRVADTLPGFKKTIITMYSDKFTPGNNEIKYHLAKLVFNRAVIQENKGRSIMTVDFNKNSGKKFSEVKTEWGQSLVELHEQLLEYSSMTGPDRGIHQFEGSEWLSRLGKNAREYYTKLLLIFLQNGILFENFLLEGESESRFTKEVFLPAFINIIKETGLKPLIAPFLPIETEGNRFWNFYPEKYFEFVRNKMIMSEFLQKKEAA